MDIFLHLFQNLVPLYGLIALGWLAGRFCNVDRESLANLAIYIVVPFVSFYYIASLEFKASYILLPFVVFALCTAVTLGFYQIGRMIYSDKQANLLAMCAAAPNAGYFGLPLAILLLPPEWVGVYVFSLTGSLICESTIIYYIANRGNFSPWQSILRVLKFPVVHAIILGLIFTTLGWSLPEVLDPYWEYFKGSYVVLGMMIIGCSLSNLSKFVVGIKFTSLTFLGKFAAWPLLTLLFIYCDQSYLGWFEAEIYKLLMVLAIVPPAANMAAFAAQLNLEPEKAATTILLSTIFALFYIPLVLMFTPF